MPTFAVNHHPSPPFLNFNEWFSNYRWALQSTSRICSQQCCTTSNWIIQIEFKYTKNGVWHSNLCASDDGWPVLTTMRERKRVKETPEWSFSEEFLTIDWWHFWMTFSFLAVRIYIWMFFEWVVQLKSRCENWYKMIESCAFVVIKLDFTIIACSVDGVTLTSICSLSLSFWYKLHAIQLYLFNWNQ